MKKILFGVFALIYLDSCVSKTSYNELKIEYDSLVSDYNVLNHQYNELKVKYEQVEPTILLNEAKEFMKKRQWFEAEQKILLLQNKYPETPQVKEGQLLIIVIVKELKLQNTSKAQSKNSNSLTTEELALGKISDWKKASYETKLTLCQNFADTFNSIQSKYEVKALEIMNCVDIYKDDNLSVNNVMVKCSQETYNFKH